jgi:hypothetical protein
MLKKTPEQFMQELVFMDEASKKLGLRTSMSTDTNIPWIMARHGTTFLHLGR